MDALLPAALKQLCVRCALTVKLPELTNGRQYGTANVLGSLLRGPMTWIHSRIPFIMETRTRCFACRPYPMAIFRIELYTAVTRSNACTRSPQESGLFHSQSALWCHFLLDISMPAFLSISHSPIILNHNNDHSRAYTIALHF